MVDIINSQGGGMVTASINGAQNGLTLTTAGGNIGVYEVNGGTTARDLGILNGAITAGPLVGADLDPTLDATTTLSSLFGGAGLTNPAANIVITNGTQSATINFAGASNIQDILNAINTSGAGVTARINDAGNGIDIVSNLNGARLSIVDAPGGGTAGELGIVLGLARTKLSDLNNGVGVSTVDGDDFGITRSDGAVIKVDISNATTLQDVVDLINNDADNTGGKLVASIDAANNRLVLTDNSGGSGDMVVQSTNGSYSAENLGIAGTAANGPAPMTLNGADLSPVGSQTQNVFSALLALRNALLANDTNAIQRAGLMVDAAKSQILGAIAEVGTREQRLELAQNRLADQKASLEKLRSETMSTNLAEAATKYQNEQTTYQAGLAVAAMLLKTSLLDYL